MRIPSPLRWFPWPAPALAALFLALAGFAAATKSVTYDEATNLGVGERLLRGGDWTARYAGDHPPLAFYLSALPEFLPAPLRGLLPPLARARLAMLLAAAALAFFVYRWAEELYGRAGGLAALALTAFSPNLLAHAPLVTPDMTLAAAVVAAGYAAWRYGRRPGAGRAAWLGLAVGVSLLSKLTALLLVPIWAVVVLWAGWPVRRGRAAGDLALVAAIAFLVLHAGYGFVGPAPAPATGFHSRLSRCVLWPLAERSLPGPFVRALDFQAAHAAKGEWGFLMGELSKQGWPHYFLIAFLIKTPIALQAILLALALSARRPVAGATGRRERWLAALCLAAPAAWLFLYMSLFNRIDIGFRYVLPVLPLAHVATGRLAAVEFPRPRRARALLLVGLAAYAAESTSVFPHYLAFFNAWIGGPANGYRYLIDSNLDWGQDAGAARRYVTAHFPDVILRPGRHFVHGRVVVNANALQGLSPEERRVYAWLRPFRPVGYIGYSYLIFDVPLRAVPRDLRGADGHAYRDEIYHVAGRPRRSEQEFRWALKCVRGRPAAYAALARIYLKQGRPDRARRVLAAAPPGPAVEALKARLGDIP